MITIDIISYLLLPMLIFLARVAEVSVATVKLMFVVNNAQKIAAVLGFIEAMITITALSRIMQDANNLLAFIMYAAGFATGTYVGMRLEEKMAYGTVLVRVVSRKIPAELLQYLSDQQYRYSMVDGNDEVENTQMLFTICKRSKVGALLQYMERVAPQALYTIEGVKQSSHQLVPKDQSSFMTKMEKVLKSWGKRTMSTQYHG